MTNFVDEKERARDNALSLGWALVLLAILFNALSFYLAIVPENKPIYALGIAAGISSMGGAYFTDIGRMYGNAQRFYEWVCLLGTIISHLIWLFASLSHQF